LLVGLGFCVWCARYRTQQKKRLMLQPALLRNAAHVQPSIPLLAPTLARAAPVAAMSIAAGVSVAADVAANSLGTVLLGYLAGAAAGPAFSAIAATTIGVKSKSRSWSELAVTTGFAVTFSLLTVALASVSVTFGSTAVSLLDGLPLLQLPLILGMVLLITALVPVTALVTGTFLSPAIPFLDKEDRDEYVEMQDSYRSDQWRPPKLWTNAADTANEDSSSSSPRREP